MDIVGVVPTSLNSSTDPVGNRAQAIFAGPRRICIGFKKIFENENLYFIS